MITIVSSSRYKINRTRIKGKGESFLLTHELDPVKTNVTIAFVGKNKMRRVSSDYKNEDVALPVLSFSYNETQEDSTLFLGEILICFPQAILLAAERNKKADDMLDSLIEHGLENLLK
jgi:rRNA maturation RNase YbeY